MARIRANDPSNFSNTAELVAQLGERGWYHSIELPDGRVTEGIQTVEQQKARLAQFKIPDDLSGKTVLDIGAWDGWYSFEMERRGAQVVAVDYVEHPGFRIAHKLLDSRVEYRVLDVYELSPDRLGRFDIVLFLGVLYHLKHPLLALEKVCALTDKMALIESFVTEAPSSEQRETNLPTMEFYETDQLCGRLDNWVGPNSECLLAFCRTAGFARAELRSVIDHRAHVMCFRHWLPEPEPSRAGRPILENALNIITGGKHVSTKHDDYLSLWFRTEERELNLANVFPEIGGYGVQPIYVGSTGDGVWQVNCKLPPGLVPAWHDVRVRTANSSLSDPVQIAVDQPHSPAQVHQLKIVGATDGKTWDPGHVWLSNDSWVSAWVEGLPENPEFEHLELRLGETKLTDLFLSLPDADGLRQVNGKLPASIGAGTYPLLISYGDTVSSPVQIDAAFPAET